MTEALGMWMMTGVLERFDKLKVVFVDEPDAVQLLRHRLGVENIMWSSDYPHPVSSWPNSRAMVETQFAGIPADEVTKMVSGNAERIWSL